MKNKIHIGLFVSITGSAVGYVLTNSFSFYPCYANNYSCRNLFNSIGDPLLCGGIALAIVFSSLFFVPSAYEAWKKFAIWFIPLAILMYVNESGRRPGLMDVFYNPPVMFRWLSVFYVVVSTFIIAVSWYRTRSQK